MCCKSCRVFWSCLFIKQIEIVWLCLGCVWEERQLPGHSLHFVGLPSSVTLVPAATLTSLYLNSPNISAARAYICQGDAYLVSLSVLNGMGNTNSAIKDPPSSISYIAGNCSDGTNLPDFSYDFSNPKWSTCTRLNYSSQYTYFSQLYTNQDPAYNLSGLAERFTYRQAFQQGSPCV